MGGFSAARVRSYVHLGLNVHEGHAQGVKHDDAERSPDILDMLGDLRRGGLGKKN